SRPEGTLLGQGLLRSYGDSALGDRVLDLTGLRRLLAFDAERGVLTCEAGISLGEILAFIVPQGWFLPVVPGTQWVTVGGAIAADVHGKNHHCRGSFADHVEEIELLTADNLRVHCSPTVRPDLFAATCGGMGLTGIILSARIRLLRVETALIRQRVIKTRSLSETLAAFDECSGWTYSVGWIDCLARGKRLGRSHIILGEHAGREDLPTSLRRHPPVRPPRWEMKVPFYFPQATLNRYSVRLFNGVYYHRPQPRDREALVPFAPFFFPLDAVRDWNRIYGRRGFTQYQFVLPRSGGRDGLERILRRISESGHGSFLAVVKLFGPGSDRPISFPMAGYTLALDIPLAPGVFPLLDELDRQVEDLGGRFYLAKDCRLPARVFHRVTPGLTEFIRIKRRVDPQSRFRSRQSDRLAVTP
ncbi:MAG TPA: FAD-binding oxidoreductase, partial [Candidatus Aminicenantes bacterium]|nr:FAD-binding oxidoreductase [Candidatus Aminicenantes bacterium]